jgi:hypothetical protein
MNSIKNYFKMRKKLLFLSILVLSLSGCQGEETAQIRFCADIRAAEPCIGEDTVFLKGYNVWAQLLLSPGFNDTAVTGNLYGYEDGKRVFIGSTRHEISKGQTIVMESMFFNMEGEFEVEFIDSKGKLLAKKGFEVW